MATTRVFKSGNSRVVRIPKEFQFDVDELEIFQRAKEVLLRKKQDNLSDVLNLFEAFSDDFMDGECIDPPLQKRDFDL